MASIRERVKLNGEISYTVDIRKKNKKALCATFNKLEDAKIWAAYKEDLIDKMVAFDIPLGEMLTVQDIFTYKIESSKKEEAKVKYVADLITEKNAWEKLLGKDYLYKDLTYDFLKNLTDEMMTQTVRIGGNKYKEDATGTIKMISPHTVRKRLAYFSSSVEFLKSQGIELRNLPLEILKYFRATYMEKPTNE